MRENREISSVEEFQMISVTALPSKRWSKIPYSLSLGWAWWFPSIEYSMGRERTGVTSQWSSQAKAISARWSWPMLTRISLDDIPFCWDGMKMVCHFVTFVVFLLKIYMDCSLPGSSVQGTLQRRTLECVAIPFPRGFSQPRDWTWVSCMAGGFFTSEPALKVYNTSLILKKRQTLFEGLRNILKNTWPVFLKTAKTIKTMESLMKLSQLREP